MAANEGYVYRERIDETTAAASVVDYLADRFRHSSREEWIARIEQGEVRVDERRASPDTLLRCGQQVTWRRPPWVEPSAPLRFDVVHEDAAILAVSKPAGLPTLPGGGFLQNTLLHLVQRGHASAAPLHRLGRWTSGLVLFALTDESRRVLSQAWRSHAVRKTYRALADGRPEHDRFDITSPIGRIPYAPLGTLHAACADGKPARSEVSVVQRHDDRFLADVSPITGRPHQIRIHLASAGHPLVGDPLYAVGGRPAAACRAVPGDPGYSLHATELVFLHPENLRECVISCAPPAALVDPTSRRA